MTIPTIAIYAICKDEASNVQNFMETAHEADHVYVADTGSTDDTMAKFEQWCQNHPWEKRKLTVQPIFVRPWRFDIGRNVALSLVPPNVDICVVLDLDETLSPHWKEAILDHWKGGVNAVRPWYVNGDGYQTFDGRRIHSRAGWVWRHPCHEQLYPYGGVANFADAREIVLTHNRVQIHSSYLDLCYMAWVEDPTDSHCQFFLGREYYVAGMYDMAAQLLRHYVEREDWTEPEERRMATMFLNWSEGMLAAKEEGLTPSPMRLRDSGLVVPV